MNISKPIFTHKNIKGSTVQQYPYSTRWENFFVVILHIYGDRAIFLIFCDHQDTESGLCEMDMGVAGPTSSQKEKKGSIGQQYPYFTRWHKNIVDILHCFGLEPFFWYYVFTKTLNLIRVKYILTYLNQYLPVKISRIYGTTISILYKTGEKYYGNYSYLWIYLELFLCHTP